MYNFVERAQPSIIWEELSTDLCSPASFLMCFNCTTFILLRPSYAAGVRCFTR